VKKVDLSEPGWGMPTLPENAAGAMIDLEGALRPLGVTPQPWADDQRKAFAGNLEVILNYKKDGEDAVVVTPPIYGSAHVRRTTVPSETDTPPWLRELNLDPRYRAAGGLGTLVIRFEQELLMASAWKQLAEHARQPAVKSRKDLAGVVTRAIAAKHIVPVSEDSLTGVSAAFRIAAAGDSPRRPSGRDEAAFRRLARPRGPFMRRLSSRGAPAAGSRARESVSAATTRARRLSDLADSMAATTLARSSTNVADTAFDLPQDEDSQQARFAPQFPEPMYTSLRDYFPDLLLPGLENLPPDTITLLETNPKFIEAYMVGLNHEMGRELLWRDYPLDPRGTFFQRFWDNRSAVDDGHTPSGSIPPLKTWPEQSRLGDHLTHAPQASASDPEARPLALLIKGQLLRRYPRTIIYAAQAEWTNETKKSRRPGTNERYPAFRASWGSDVTVLGFDLTDKQALYDNDGLGWFFVIQQPPTEPGFGLDEPVDNATFGSPPATWADLSWANLVANPADLRTANYVGIGRLPSTLRLPAKAADPAGTPVTQATWGRNSAHMAIITEQTAFRLVIHASQWLKGG
jgi:hypothetical protein